LPHLISRCQQNLSIIGPKCRQIPVLEEADGMEHLSRFAVKHLAGTQVTACHGPRHNVVRIYAHI
jgi:hypothetical protein